MSRRGWLAAVIAIATLTTGVAAAESIGAEIPTCARISDQVGGRL